MCLRFKIVGDWVLDKNTGLFWLRRPPPRTTYTFREANVFAERINGRLPTIKEFVSLFDYSEYNPALPKDHKFIDIQCSYYWTGVSCADAKSQVWCISMRYGTIHGTASYGYNHVWPVKESLPSA